MEADEALSAAFPGVQAAIVTVQTPGGEASERVDYPKGEPENPLTAEEFRSRYDALTAYAGVAGADSAAVFELVSRGGASADELVRRL